MEIESLTLYADGACRGNPGPGAIGVVLLDSSGQPIVTISREVGVTTNNRAEYMALLAGLETALALQPRHLEVRMDSELVVNQILGRYRVKDRHLRPLFQRAQQLLGRFPSVEVTHIPRTLNAAADALAGAAFH